jgi:hypothetical protein
LTGVLSSNGALGLAWAGTPKARRQAPTKHANACITPLIVTASLPNRGSSRGFLIGVRLISQPAFNAPADI